MGDSTQNFSSPNISGHPESSKDATEHTKARHAEVAAGLSFTTDDFELASRGLIATHPTGFIDGPLGVPARDISDYDFINDREAPATVDPSLWRHAQLNNIHGLFKVDDGLYQVRGYDVAVVSFIEGETGWIIIDPLMTEPTASAALTMANEHLGERPVKAIIYTHSHTDHYGGVRGVTTPEAVANGEVDIYAPEGFLDAVVAENLIGGNAMFRRTQYQFGIFLPKNERQHVDIGLGKTLALAPPGLLAPTHDITHTGQEVVIDGVRVVFQITPEAEAPAEMNFFFPDKGWLCMAENCTHNMHNLIPFRGAKARDTLAWSKYIAEAMDMFGADSKLVFASHHWPRWGHDEVTEFLSRQRDMYRWIHDQTMRMASRGLVANEIAEELEMPPEFQDESHTRGYYGSLAHNVKAVYQLYLSWYDGNPAHLWPHPPVEAAQRYVKFMGGAESVLAQARESFAEGDYRWVAEVVNHLVFAEPDNPEALALQADALEQLGYQSESATWRNAYLTGAMELRTSPPPVRAVHRKDMVEVISLSQLTDTMGIRVKSEDVGGVNVRVAVNLTDSGEQGVIGLQRRTLRFDAGEPVGEVDAVMSLTKSTMVDLVIVAQSYAEALASGLIEVDNPDLARQLFDNLEEHFSNFNIVTP